MSKLPAALLLLVPAVALAAQYRPAANYRGDYALQCDSATLSLDLGLAYGTTTGANGNWGDVFDLDLPCEVPVSDIADFAQDIEDTCTGANLPSDVCVDAADQVYTALLPFASVGTDVLPTGLTLYVDTANWFSRWTGLYSTYGAHTFADGRVAGWNYALDNNAGYNEGKINALGIGVGPAAGADGAGCTVAGVATVQGRINPLAGYDLTATFGMNQSLICAIANEAGGVVATLGVTFHGWMTGQKVP